jgi:hypothetical protein
LKDEAKLSPPLSQKSFVLVEIAQYRLDFANTYFIHEPKGINTNELNLGKSNVGLNSFVIFGLLIPQTSYCTHELHYTIQIVVIL